jgi:hypothetical protein
MTHLLVTNYRGAHEQVLTAMGPDMAQRHGRERLGFAADH